MNFALESYRKSLLLFVCCRSPVIQADGVSAGGPHEGGNVGSGATALWRAAERGLPGLPVHRSQPTGDRHAGVFPSEDPVSQFTVGPAGTHSSGQSTTLALTKLISRYSF